MSCGEPSMQVGLFDSPHQAKSFIIRSINHAAVRKSPHFLRQIKVNEKRKAQY